MRQPAHQQSALRNPLNRILGTESAVRILRVLSQTEHPLGAADLARMTTLNPTGVRNSLKDLIATGILTRVGGGSRSFVRLRPDHPLALPLRRLFAAESARLESITGSIARIAHALNPIPRSIWMQGPVADSADTANEPLTVGVLAGDKDLEPVLETFREQVAKLEKKQDVTIDVRGFSPADLATLSAHERKDITGAIPVWGPHPSAFFPGQAQKADRPSKRTHKLADAGALALGRRILQKLEEDPSLIERARKRVLSRMKTASAAEQKELKEWDRVLRTRSPTLLRQLLTDPGQRGTRLRQTMPFLDALTREDRDETLKRASATGNH